MCAGKERDLYFWQRLRMLQFVVLFTVGWLKGRRFIQLIYRLTVFLLLRQWLPHIFVAICPSFKKIIMKKINKNGGYITFILQNGIYSASMTLFHKYRLFLICLMIRLLLQCCFELLKLDNFGCADFQWMDKMMRILKIA